MLGMYQIIFSLKRVSSTVFLHKNVDIYIYLFLKCYVKKKKNLGED